MFVMTIHFVIQYLIFQAFNTLPFWPFLFVWVILIIALLFGGIYIYDFDKKLDEDPSAGLKLIICGIGLFSAIFLTIILLFGLGIMDFWQFLSTHFQFAVFILPTFIQIAITCVLYLIAGIQIRRATITYEPVPSLPNRNRIIAIGGIGFLCILIAIAIQPYVLVIVMQYEMEILLYGWIIFLLTGGVLGFIAVYMYEFSSRSRYDKVRLKEIPEDRFLCPLCHTEIDPGSYRCIHCDHIIPNGLKPYRETQTEWS